MCRRLRTTVPVHPKGLLPERVSLSRFRNQDTTTRQRQRTYFNRRHRATSLPALEPVAEVWVTDCKAKARVMRPSDRPRSYVVRTSAGVVLLRNRNFLVRFVSQPNDSEGDEGSYDFPQADSWVEIEQGSMRVTDSMVSHDSSSPLLPRTDPPEYGTRAGRLVRQRARYAFSN